MKLITTTAAILGFLTAGITNAAPAGGPFIVEPATKEEQEATFRGTVNSNPGPVIPDSDMVFPPIISNSNPQHVRRDAGGPMQEMKQIRRDTVEPLQETSSADVDDLKAGKERQREEWAGRRIIGWADN